MDGGAWRAAVYGVAQSRTQLKQLSIASTWGRSVHHPVSQCPSVPIPTHDDSNPSPLPLNPHASHFLQTGSLQIFRGNGSHRPALSQLLTFPADSAYTLHTPFLQYQGMCIHPPGQGQVYVLDGYIAHPGPVAQIFLYCLQYVQPLLYGQCLGLSQSCF